MRKAFLITVFGLLLYLPGRAQSGAEIEVLTPDVCVPGKVSMRVINCSSCISYEWEVGAGTGFKFAGSDYATIINDTGWYDVSVKLKTSGGAIVLIGKKKAFYGRKAPTIDFSVNKTAFCKGADTLIVTDKTPNIKSRDWLVDGKIFYNGPRVLKYPMTQSQGYRSIYILVRDSWDCKGTLLKDSLVGVWDSVKTTIIASKQKGCAPAFIDYGFTADSGVHKIKSVLWNFQGGVVASSTVRNPKNIYYALGDTFDVKLTLATDKGCMYTYNKNNFISLGDSSKLVINFSKNKFCANELVTATVSNTKTALASWKFQNGKVDPFPLTGSSINFRFKDTLSPTVTVEETYKGCTSYATYAQKITILGPVAGVQPESPFYCSVPKTLKFINATKEDPLGTSWQWRLLDKGGSVLSTATTKTFNYYTTTGANYSVFLKATGTNGCADSVFLNPASVYGHIDSNFTVEPNPVCPGKQVVTKPAAGFGSLVHPNSYKWYFYDLNGNVVHTDNQENAKYTYTKTGKYSVKMVVSNNDNCKDSLFLKDTVHVVAPTIKFNVSDSFVCINHKVTVHAKFSVPKGNLVSYWQMVNIDTANTDVYAHKDSVDIYPRVTGRYRLFFYVVDTGKNGCSFTYVYPNLIRVSGIRFTVATSNNVGCVPLNTNLTSKLVFNVNYKSGSNAVNYQWKSTQPGEVTFSTPNASATSATVVFKRDQHVHLVYSNQSGCIDSSAYHRLNVEFKAGFYVGNKAKCKGQIDNVYNNSSYWATNFQYSSDPSVTFIPNANVPNPQIRFNKAGVFNIRLIASSGNCVDTSYVYNLEVTTIKADFSTPDSLTYCAPKLINIINNSPTAVFSYWKFGDGDSARTLFNDIAGHLYMKNNSNPGYDVRLIAENQYGCRDTIVKKGYIRIIGPVPEFTVSNILGCEPLGVVFKNKSKDYNRMFVDYDNGIVLDSTVLGTYYYRVTNKALPLQKFRPKILLYDSFGCSVLAFSPDSITVLKNAEALHSFSSVNFVKNNEGCANNLLVKFQNRSKFYIKTYWDFNGDGKIDIINQNNPSYLFDKAGVYKPVIIAENINGCIDTFKKDSITVWEPPKANFKSSADTTCANKVVNFWSTTVFSNQPFSYSWNFGVLPVFDDTASTPAASWKYNTPFNHAVKLKVVDIKGCNDEIIKNIVVNDTAGPVPQQLAYITVRDDKYVDFYWRKTKLGNFYNYRTYLDSIGLWQKYQSYNRGDTLLSVMHGSDVKNRRFCYTIKVEDTCNQLGKAAVSHCTMVLRDTSPAPFTVRLSWLAYDWWDTDLSHYEVFRKDPGSNSYVKITDVKSNRQTYTDSFLCDKTYCYYVEAVHKNRIYRSRSNTTCGKPIYLKPDSFVNINLVTVKNSAFSEVEWESYYKYYRNWSYVLQRSNTGLSGSFSNVLETKNLKATDLSAKVNDRTNFYRIVFKDHCGVESKPGVVSNTIWLRSASKTRNNTNLSWNSYSYWYSGVKNYGVQLRDNTGKFNTLKVLPPSGLSLDSVDIEKYNLDSICFRVFAVKDSSTLDTSWSNVVCIVPASYVHVPTAFSPDGNNINEVFKPSVGFVHKNSVNQNEKYEFRVFNRWGQMVFESNNPENGWDGTFIGEKSPSGLYIWTLKALGHDGIPHRLDGTVYLIR